MRCLSARITSHTLDPLGVPALKVTYTESLSLKAGQFLLANLPGSSSPLRARLFPVEIDQSGFVSDHIPDPAWFPGQSIDLLGPLGKPFTIPPEARHWLLISLGDHPERLLPLVQSGIQASASLAFWSDHPTVTLPALVERPAEALEALDWADFIAVEVEHLDWHEHRADFYQQLRNRTSQAQLLINLPTPCGIGGCQACSFPGRKLSHLACQAGLVYPLEEFLD